MSFPKVHARNSLSLSASVKTVSQLCATRLVRFMGALGKAPNEHHLLELEIALNVADPRHSEPPASDARRILDIGCGAGQTLIASYRGRSSFGVDLDLGALQLGRTLTDHVRFAAARAEALPFKAASFDMVISRVALPYTNIMRTLSEANRVLTPEGRLWMVLHPFSVPWGEAKAASFKGRVYFLYVVLNSLLFHCTRKEFRFRNRGYESFQTVWGMKQALASQGFVIAQVEKTPHFTITAVKDYGCASGIGGLGNSDCK